MLPCGQVPALGIARWSNGTPLPKGRKRHAQSQRSIHKLLSSAALLAALIIRAAAPAQNPAHSNHANIHQPSGFISFDYPGATNTQATAITLPETSWADI
jgi:hypothetical protein